MAKTINILDSYEEGSARDRAELIYSHYCSFIGILDDCRMKLIYEIQAEEQFNRSHYRDELGGACPESWPSQRSDSPAGSK